MFAIYRPLRNKLDRKNPENQEFLDFLRYRPLGLGENGNEELCQWVRDYVKKYPDNLTIGAKVNCGIEDVFELTNSIHHAWTDNPQVSEVNEDAFNSSTSVGDFFKDLSSGNVIVVMPIGFTQLDGLEIEG